MLPSLVCLPLVTDAKRPRDDDSPLVFVVLTTTGALLRLDRSLEVPLIEELSASVQRFLDSGCSDDEIVKSIMTFHMPLTSEPRDLNMILAISNKADGLSTHALLTFTRPYNAIQTVSEFSALRTRGIGIDDSLGDTVYGALGQLYFELLCSSGGFGRALVEETIVYLQQEWENASFVLTQERLSFKRALQNHCMIDIMAKQSSIGFWQKLQFVAMSHSRNGLTAMRRPLWL